MENRNLKIKYKHLIYVIVVALLCVIAVTQASQSASAVSFTNDFSAGSSAECMVTIEASSNRILYGHNYHKKRPMASVTKILTAITVIENCTDLKAKVKVPAKAQGVEGSSIYLEAGEEISTEDLLYGLMLQSGNDCAVTLAITTSGSVENFAQLMNRTAKKIGANESKFVNPHGLHDDNHYTTAYDLAIITSYAMKNPIFKQIVSSQSRKIERTKENGIEFIVNKNKILKTFKGGDGVKTGFTKKAGRCLVASATREGMQIISVVLNCGPMFEDCTHLMECAFKEYKLCKVASGGTLADAEILNSKHKTVPAGILKDLYYPLKKGEEVKAEVKVKENLRAPIKKGTEIGTVCYTLNNRLIFEEKLYSMEDAAALSLGDFLKDLLSQW